MKEKRFHRLRHIIKHSEGNADLFCMEKKREDETHSDLCKRILRNVNYVKKNGKLRLI